MKIFAMAVVAASLLASAAQAATFGFSFADDADLSKIVSGYLTFDDAVLTVDGKYKALSAKLTTVPEGFEIFAEREFTFSPANSFTFVSGNITAGEYLTAATNKEGRARPFGLNFLNFSFLDNPDGSETFGADGGIQAATPVTFSRIADGVSAVPVPAALPLMLGGLGAIGALRFRRKAA